jgi:hypothetical protein
VKRGKKIKGPSARGAGGVARLERALRAIRKIAMHAAHGRLPHGYTSPYTTLGAISRYALRALPSVKPRASRTRGEGRAKCR